jgi:hypothetical protein
MRKMIFSTVALVAFSFAGMANEIEEKKVEKTKIEIEKNETSSDTPCADSAGVLLNFMMDEMNLTFSQAWRLSEIAFQHCIRNTYH